MVAMQAEVDIEKRDGSEEVNFIVCVKEGSYELSFT